MGERGRRRSVFRWAVVLVALVSVCAPGLPAVAGATTPATPGTLTRSELAAGAAHACLAGGGAATLDWSALHNPILSSPSAGVKDEALVWAGGRWHMLFSQVTHDRSLPDGVRWNIATATSSDLVHWSRIDPWPAQPGVLGVASPDIVRDPSGGFLVTYQSDPGSTGRPSDQSRLFYRTSSNLTSWSTPHPLAQSLAPRPGDRMIDGAFVFTGRQLLLGFKYSSPSQPDVFEIARSTTGRPSGPWQLVGRPDIQVVGGTIENYEFVSVDRTWRLVATSNNLDEPWLFTLAGNPNSASGWLTWTDGVELNVPAQAFDSGPGVSGIDYEHANSAFLCNASSLPGHEVYLLYAGSDELTAFGGWGHAAIGIARSTDLVHWQVPSGGG